MSTYDNKKITHHNSSVHHDDQKSVHVPVLLEEIIDHLALTPSSILCDATAGGGGHAYACAQFLGKEGMIIALDQDEDAILRTTQRLADIACRTSIHQENFRNLGKVLEQENIHCCNAFIFDLGWSSDQIADPERGLSFQHNGPLHMTLKKNPTPEDITAFDVVNDWAEDTIADIIYAFGDERYSRRIAKNIVEGRKESTIRDTATLVDIIKQSVPAKYRNGKIHPATRTFQALRIVVNDEYAAIKEGLRSAISHLCPGGTIAVISFHSGEDRIVKHIFNEYHEQGDIQKVNKKVIIASEKEQQENPRSRSAKLRIIKKL